MRTKTLIYGILSFICFGMAALFLVVAKPFKPIGVYSTKVETVDAVMQTTSQATETAKTNETVYHYDTEYGNRDLDEAKVRLCSEFTKETFNIGYRNIINSRSAYVSGILGLFTSGKVDHGAYHFTPEQFADFLANMVEENLLQLEAEVLPSACFTKNDVTYMNGMMTLTVHAGENLDQLGNFFGTKLELNQPAQIPVCIMISDTTGKIVGFKPIQVKAN